MQALKVFIRTSLSAVAILSIAIFSRPCNAAESPIVAMAFSKTGDELAVASQAGIRICSWPELETKVELLLQCDNPHSLEFSPSGDKLAVAGGNPAESGQLEIFDWNSKTSTSLIEVGADVLMDVVWLDENQVALACLDFNCYLWNVTDQKQINQLSGHSRGITTLCIIPDGNLMVTAGIDQSLRAWNLGSQQLVRSMSIHSRPVRNICTKPKQEGLPMVASVSTDRTVRFWQPTIGRMVRFAKLPAVPLDVAWANDGETVAVACEDGKLRIVDATRVKVLKEFPAIKGWAFSVTAHPSDGSFAVGGADNQLVRVSD